MFILASTAGLIAEVIAPTVPTDMLLLEAGIGVPTALVIATEAGTTFLECLVVSDPTALVIATVPNV